jgi:hypothetical protein
MGIALKHPPQASLSTATTANHCDNFYGSSHNWQATGYQHGFCFSSQFIKCFSSFSLLQLSFQL